MPGKVKYFLPSDPLLSDLSALQVGEDDLVLGDVGLREVPHLNVCGQSSSHVSHLYHSDLLCGNLVLLRYQKLSQVRYCGHKFTSRE